MNWVENIETAMADCPSAEELEVERQEGGKLDTEISDGNSNP